MDTQKPSLTTKAEPKTGQEAPNRFSGMPWELILMVMENLSQHELFTLMRANRLFAAIGQPVLYRRDAEAHEDSVPEAQMFAALKSGNDSSLALKILELSLGNKGKLNFQNVYELEVHWLISDDTRRTIATRASLLHFAVMFGSPAFVNQLRGKVVPDADWTFPDPVGYGIFDLAMNKFGLKRQDFDDFALYNVLSKRTHGGSNMEFAIGATPLSCALQKGDWQMTEALLSFRNEQSFPYHLLIPSMLGPTNSDFEGLPATLLHWAAMRTEADPRSQKLLPDQQIISSCRPYLDDYSLEGSPLITAIELGNAPFVALLLKAGVDPNVVGVGGRSPLQWACRLHRCFLPKNVQHSKRILECVKVLLEFQADPNVESSNKTAFEFAIEGISVKLDGWDHTKDVVNAIWSSDMVDVHRVLGDGLTVSQRHAKRMVDLPEDSPALAYYGTLLGWMVKKGGLVNIQGEQSLLYNAFVSGRSAMHEALKKAGAEMASSEAEIICEDWWIPGDEKERERVEKALGYSRETFRKIMQGPEMVARFYCALARRNDDSTIKKKVKEVTWPRNSTTIANFALEVIARASPKDKMRKRWMELGFDASVGDSIGLLVLDKLGDPDHHAPNDALKDIQRLFSLGALPFEPYNGKSAYDRVKELRLREQKMYAGGRAQKKYQDMREWFENVKDGEVSRESGKLELSAEDLEGRADEEDGQYIKEDEDDAEEGESDQEDGKEDSDVEMQD